MKPNEILSPLATHSTQTYLGKGLHTLGLIDWILQQTGSADVVVSTFSTSVDFLSGFYNLRKRGLVLSASLIVDLKAARKTAKLDTLMRSCFEHVHMAENHSKVVVVTDVKAEYSNDHDALPRFTFSYRYAKRNQNILDLDRAGRIFDNTFDYTFN